MKKPLAITFLADEKEVRKALAILTGELISDEELEKKFFSNPIDMDMEMMGEDSKNMILAFVAIIAGSKGYEIS